MEVQQKYAAAASVIFAVLQERGPRMSDYFCSLVLVEINYELFCNVSRLFRKFQQQEI